MAEYSCRICGSKDIHKAIDLGVMPNANNLVAKAFLDKVKSYPLNFWWCANCTLFQQVEFVPRDELFNKNYPYVTGVNTPSVEDFKGFAIAMKKKLKKRNFAVVVASNDGTEIRVLKEFGDFKKVIGVDPADNLARMANERGLFTINDFFSQELSREIARKYGHADFVVAKGVFAHIPDPRDMLLGMKDLIADDGTIAIEVHYLKNLIQDMMIDTLYAEHYFEWTVKSMKHLANSVGLKMVDVEYFEMRGGSIRALLKKHGSEKPTEKFIAQEASVGLRSLKTIQSLQKRADARKNKFRSMIKRLKAQGNKISVWTAAAKVPTLLNFCGLSKKEIDYSYDITESKIGKYIPKAGIEIKRESLVEKDMPDYLILGSWNYMDVALHKFANYMKRGGKLINPVDCSIITTRDLKGLGRSADAPKGIASKDATERMRKEGKKIYDSLMRGERHRIKDIKVVSSHRVGHLYLQELRYKVEDVDGYWTKVSSYGEKANGVTVMPVIKKGGRDYIILLFKPQPAMGQWSIALPSGAVKKMETPEECAARELEEETGFRAGRMTWLMSQSNLPERIENVDQVFVAEDLVPGSREGDYEERPIKILALSIPEVVRLLDQNRIQSAMITAVLSTYLHKNNQLIKAAFSAVKHNE